VRTISQEPGQRAEDVGRLVYCQEMISIASQDEDIPLAAEFVYKGHPTLTRMRRLCTARLLLELAWVMQS